MVKITKDERDYLESKGFVFGEDLHRTYGKYKHYFATESRKIMRELKQYRKSRLAR